MNKSLKKYAKLKKQLQLLDNSSESYKKTCSDAAKFRVQKYINIQDTRNIGADNPYRNCSRKGSTFLNKNN